jgi:hypothetical protein
MYDIITLKCRCGDYIFKGSNDLDLAEFLRYAIAGGWRRINEEPVTAVESDGVTEIVLSGTCAKCYRRQSFPLGIFRRSAPASFQKRS